MNNRFEHLVRPHLLEFKPYASARDEFSGSSKVFLDANENPEDLTSKGLNRYPDPHHKQLRSKLATMKGVRKDQLILGNGSDEVLDLIFRVFCVPGKDAVVLNPPTYGMYGDLARLNDIETVEIPLTENFQLDTAKIKALDIPSKLLFVCSPNNPSGNMMDEEAIESILNEYKGLVVIDEAYADFMQKESWVSRLEEFENLIVCQTFSKAWALAGARVGIAFAHPDIIRLMEAIKPPYNLDNLCQSAALEVLDQQQLVENRVRVIINERDRLENALKQIPLVSIVYPSDANFLLVRVDDATKRYHQLMEKGIILRDRSKLPGCENCLRITVGTPGENDFLITTLKDL
jgi:histidinol-phosphate aminotransferase